MPFIQLNICLLQFSDSCRVRITYDKSSEGEIAPSQGAASLHLRHGVKSLFTLNKKYECVITTLL